MKIKRFILSVIAMWVVVTGYSQLYFADTSIYKDKFPEVTEETKDIAYEAQSSELAGEWIGHTTSYKFNTNGTGECISLGGRLKDIQYYRISRFKWIKKGTRLTLTFSEKPVIAIYNKDIYNKLSARLKNEVDADLAIQNSYKKDDPLRLRDVCFINKDFLIFGEFYPDEYYIKSEYFKQLQEETKEEELKRKEEEEKAIAEKEEAERIEQIDQNIYSPNDPGVIPAHFDDKHESYGAWLSRNLKYPQAAQENNKQGNVVVKFVVNKDGTISDAQVIESSDEDLDKEALRVVKRMPMVPAQKNGQKVKSWLETTISFRLQN